MTYLNNEKTSPFAKFSDSERLLKQEPEFITSVRITELDKAILTLINDSLVSTSALLFRQLCDRDDVNEQKNIKVRLAKLWKAQFVEKYMYTDDSGARSSNRVYTLGYRGRGLLKSIGIQPKRTTYVQSLTENEPLHVKRLLSAVQFCVLCGYQPKMIAEPVFIPGRGEKAKYIFRAHAQITDNDETLFVESVRRDEREGEYFVNKLGRVSEVIKRKSKANSKLGKTQTVVLVCEDNAHMYDVMHMIQTLKLPSNISLKITNDLDLYAGTAQILDVPTVKHSFWDFLRLAS